MNWQQLSINTNQTLQLIEAIFSYKSSESAIRLGQARGVALMTLAQKGLSVEAYNPMTVKQSVGGHGQSGKEEIIRITSRLLSLQDPLPSDAADAAAIAITHIIRSTLQSKFFQQNTGQKHSSGLTENQKKIIELQKRILEHHLRNRVVLHCKIG